MPNFSIVSVSDVQGSQVTGNWIQDHSGGTLETAQQVADMYAAHSRLPVAVVESHCGFIYPGQEICRQSLYQVEGSRA